jgi:hypothetical protein
MAEILFVTMGFVAGSPSHLDLSIAAAKELKTEKAERSIRGSPMSVSFDSSFIERVDCIM